MANPMTQQYDVFISFKNRDKDERPTRDSELALKIYDALASRGLEVFFSDVSLKKRGVSAYKDDIDKALENSRVLVAVGTSRENLESKWVKHEWDGFHQDILDGRHFGSLFTYIAEMDEKSLPSTLRRCTVIRDGQGSLETLCDFVSNA